MAPGFLSKLVKPGSHSRNSSATSSPQSPASSRHPSISFSSSNSSKGSQNGTRPPQILIAARAEESEYSDSGPNVTVIPPSPSISGTSGNSIPLPPSPAPAQRELAPDEHSEDARRRVQSLPAASPSPPSSARMSDDGLPTPTPATTTFSTLPPTPSSSTTQNHTLPSEAMRGDSKSQGSKPGTVRGTHPRAATVAEGSLQAPKELRHASSNKSLRSKLSIMLPSRDTPPASQSSSRHDRSISAPHPPSPPAHSDGSALVESPTGLGHDLPPIPHPLPTSSTTPSFGSTLAVPDHSDAVSIKSVGSTASKKRRPWRRGSNPSTPVPPVPRSATLGPTPSSSKSSSRKNTGLASALAASGLAMANPGMTVPLISPAPAETNPASARGRTSYEGPRSRATSYGGGSDYSDRDSFHSGNDSDSEGSDSDELDLDPEDIPVTGFAVASNKRNQDFHDLFPSVPEGDYLIEGEFPFCAAPCSTNVVPQTMAAPCNVRSSSKDGYTSRRITCVSMQTYSVGSQMYVLGYALALALTLTLFYLPHLRHLPSAS